jgi:hypothetical protein
MVYERKRAVTKSSVYDIDKSQETENVKGERTRPRIPYYADTYYEI